MWRNIILLVSLTLNVFIIGLIMGGHLFGDRPTEGKPPPKMVRSIADDPSLLISRRNISQLPAEYRRQARQMLSGRLPEIREYERKISEARRDMNAILAAEEYDQAAAEEAMQTLRQLQAGQQALVSRTMLDFLAGLPDEERRKIVARAEEQRLARAERRERFRNRMRERRQREAE